MGEMMEATFWESCFGGSLLFINGGLVLLGRLFPRLGRMMEG